MTTTPDEVGVMRLPGSSTQTHRLYDISGPNPLLQIALDCRVASRAAAGSLGTAAGRAPKPAPAVPKAADGEGPTSTVVYRKKVPLMLGRHKASGLVGLATEVAGQVLIEAEGEHATFPAAEVEAFDLPPVPLTAFCARENHAGVAGRQSAQEECRLVVCLGSVLAVRWACPAADAVHGAPQDHLGACLKRVPHCVLHADVVDPSWVRPFLMDRVSETVPVGGHALPEEFFLSAAPGQNLAIVRIDAADGAARAMAALHAANFVAFPTITAQAQAKGLLQRVQVKVLRPAGKENVVAEVRKHIALPRMRAMAKEALGRVLEVVGKTVEDLRPPEAEADLHRAARLLHCQVMLMPDGSGDPGVMMWLKAAVPVATALLALCSGSTPRAQKVARAVFMDVAANYVEVVLLVGAFDASECMDETVLKDKVTKAFGHNGVSIQKTRAQHADLVRRAYYHANQGGEQAPAARTILRSLAVYGLGVWTPNTYTSGWSSTAKPLKRHLTTKWVTIAAWRDVANNPLPPPLTTSEP